MRDRQRKQGHRFYEMYMEWRQSSRETLKSEHVTRTKDVGEIMSRICTDRNGLRPTRGNRRNRARSVTCWS